jgi:hypothetical protein
MKGFFIPGLLSLRVKELFVNLKVYCEICP